MSDETQPVEEPVAPESPEAPAAVLVPEEPFIPQPAPDGGVGDPPSGPVTGDQSAPAATDPVVNTAASLTAPPAPAEETAPESRDETHDGIDPQTGAITADALAARDKIMAELREAGHKISAWEDAIRHWASEAEARAAALVASTSPTDDPT